MPKKPPTMSLEGWEDPWYLSASSQAIWEECPRKYFYKYGLGLKARYSDLISIHLVYGSALHMGLPWTLIGDLDRAVKEFLASWGDGDTLYAGDKTLEKKCRVRGKLQLAEFASSHGPGRAIYEVMRDPAPRDQGIGEEGMLASEAVENALFETNFQLDLGARIGKKPLPVIGKIDLPARMRSTDDLFAVDFKSSSQMSSSLEACFGMTPQSMVYPLAMEMLWGKRCRGIVYDMVLCAKASVNSQSFPILVQRHQMRDEIESVRRIGREIETCLQEEFFPKRFSSCSGYTNHGCSWSQCEFQSLCKIKDWEDLGDAFEVSRHRSWNPEKYTSLTISARKRSKS